MVGEVKGIAELGEALLNDSVSVAKAILNLVTLDAETWGALKDKVIREHTSAAGKPYQITHLIGTDLVAVGSLVLPLTKLSKANMIATVANLSDNVVLTLAKFRNAATGAYRVANNVANGAIKLSQVSGKIVADIADELCWATGQTVNLFGNSWVLQTTDGVNFSVKLGDRVLAVTQVAQDASGRILATIKNGADEVMVVIKGSYRTLDDIWRLHPNLKTYFDDLPTSARANLQEFSPNSLKKALDRLSANPELTTVLKQNPDISKLWTAHHGSFTPDELIRARELFGEMTELSPDARKLAEDLAEESGEKAKMMEIFGLGGAFEDIVFDAFKAEHGLINSQVVRQVTLEVDGVAIRVDYLGYNPTTRTYHLAEAKFSTLDKNWNTDWLSAATDNQAIVLPKVQAGTVTEYVVKASDARKLELLEGIGLGNNSKISFGNTTFNIFGSQANQQVVKTIVTLK